MTGMTNELQNATELERVTCSRCGGTGTYSYCQSYGTTCFKCAGAKRVFTKRGAVANDFLISLLSKQASQLQVGDKVRELGVTNGGEVFNAWFVVEAIEPLTVDNAGCYQIDTNGNKIVPANHLVLRLRRTENETLGVQYAADKVVRVACTAEVKKAAIAQALAYQSTLTKTGTVRKVRG